MLRLLGKANFLKLEYELQDSILCNGFRGIILKCTERYDNQKKNLCFRHLLLFASRLDKPISVYRYSTLPNFHYV